MAGVRRLRFPPPSALAGAMPSQGRFRTLLARLRGPHGALLNTFIIWHLFTTHVGSLKATQGPSMLPTLRSSGDWILVDRVSHRLCTDPLSGIERGTLVTYISPVDRSRHVCKRLIGLPGDIVEVEVATEDEFGLEERRAMHTVVPQGHFWTQGDNKSATLDSNSYGPVPYGLFTGQVRRIISFWPPSIRRVETVSFINTEAR
ncbi:peptidase S24/S26A/S26B/S26C [Cantharellus anzutake]|uniref:peptidase S24/S26A/S26B/S26C n=1 Tax=Cantharellus anzutake TaxID=1750568 RepID=UPI001904D7F8|nr:peptidase S24/S26A/S26B/S26C [Cantharellus anzutake]KAF8337529.1 peptidase S24/S26A/S26B/S26C [Cantharellus anzutake]